MHRRTDLGKSAPSDAGNVAHNCHVSVSCSSVAPTMLRSTAVYSGLSPHLILELCRDGIIRAR